MYGDSHSHLDGLTDEQLKAILTEARACGVEIVMGVGTSLDSSEATVKIARRFPGIVASAGVHPWWGTPADLENGARLRDLATQKEVGAIGEIGVDLEKNPTTGDLQLSLLELQLDLAQELDRPILLHCKGGREQVQSLLRKRPSVRGVLHGFNGTAADAQSWLELGLSIGIGVRTFSRNYSPAVEEAVRCIPLDNMLLETDSSARSYKEEGLQPARVADVAAKIAPIHGVTAEEVGRRTTANLKKMLGIR